MARFLYVTVPLILLALSSGLLAAWLMLFARPDRRLEEMLVKVGGTVSILLIAWLAGMSFLQHQVPVLMPGQVLVFLGVFIWVVHSLTQIQVRQRLLSVLPLTTLIVLLILGVAAGLRPNDSVPESLLGFRSGFHISLSLAGVALLLGSGVFGAGRLILHRQIKGRTFGSWFQHMPSLVDLDRLRHSTLLGGWTLVTVSLASAMVGLYLDATHDKAMLSHLHPMLTLWVLISGLVAADRFRWMGSHRLALGSLLLSGLMTILLVVSVIEIFTGRFA